MDLRVDDGVVTMLGGLGEELMKFWEVCVSDSTTPGIHALGQGISMLLGEGLVVTVAKVL